MLFTIEVAPTRMFEYFNALLLSNSNENEETQGGWIVKTFARAILVESTLTIFFFLYDILKEIQNYLVWHRCGIFGRLKIIFKTKIKFFVNVQS